MKADLSVELAEATLYADDAAAAVVKEFKSGKLSLGIYDIGKTAAFLPRLIKICAVRKMSSTVKSMTVTAPALIRRP